jgi:hypothetical protein
MRGGVGRIIGTCAVVVLTALLAVAGVYNSIVGGLVSGWLAGLPRPWLPAAAVAAALLLLGSVLNAAIGMSSPVRRRLLACSVVAAPFLVNVADGEASDLVRGGWASDLLWSAPLTVVTASWLQLLAWRAARRNGWLRASSPEAVHHELRHRMQREWVDTRRRKALLGRSFLHLGVELSGGGIAAGYGELADALRETGGMLLTGPQGAGKTIKAAEVVGELCADRHHDLVPIMLSLDAYGTSAGGPPPAEHIEDWIAEQLAGKPYRVRPKATRRLLSQPAHGEIVVILDAFDQVPARAQMRCAREIARFRASHPQVVVCVTSTPGVVTPADLGLTGSARMRPASLREIHQALKRAGFPRHDPIHTRIDTDLSYRDFFGLPLVLSLATPRIKGVGAPGPPPTLDSLVDDYVEEKLKRLPALPDDPDLARRYLALVADNASPGGFRPYDLRPGMLDRSLRVHLYAWLPGSVVVAVAMTYLCVVGSPYHGFTGALSVLERVAVGAVLGLIAAFASNAQADGRLAPLAVRLGFDRKALRHIWRSSLNGVKYGMLIAAGVTVLVSGVVGTVWLADAHYRAENGYRKFLIGSQTPAHAATELLIAAGKIAAICWCVGAGWGLVRAVSTGLRVHKPDAQDGARPQPPRRMVRAASASLLAGIFGGSSVAIAVGLANFAAKATNTGGLGNVSWGLILVAGAGFGLAFGGWAFLAYLGIRADLVRTNQAPILLGRFLHNLTRKELLHDLSGRYEFVHETVRQNLAATQDPGTQAKTDQVPSNQ